MAYVVELAQNQKELYLTLLHSWLTPAIAAGDALLQIGSVNEAIVSYNAALVRPGATQGAEIGLAEAFLETAPGGPSLL